MPQGRQRGGSTMFIALAGLGLLAGCAGSNHDATTTSTTVVAPSTTSASSFASTEARRSEVLSAYRAGWLAFEQASATSNAFDPQLADSMADPLLQQVRANLAGDKENGVVARGSFTLHPTVVALTATTAQVSDCAYSTSELVYAKTGQPVPPVTPPENDGVKATLVLLGSVWKVAQQTVTDGLCGPVS